MPRIPGRPCVQTLFSSLTQLLLFNQLCPTLCDPMDWSMPGFSVLHHLPALAQTHVHWVGEGPSFPLPPHTLSWRRQTQEEGVHLLLSRFFQLFYEAPGLQSHLNRGRGRRPCPRRLNSEVTPGLLGRDSHMAPVNCKGSWEMQGGMDIHREYGPSPLQVKNQWDKRQLPQSLRLPRGKNIINWDVER